MLEVGGEKKQPKKPLVHGVNFQVSFGGLTQVEEEGGGGGGWECD